MFKHGPKLALIGPHLAMPGGCANGPGSVRATTSPPANGAEAIPRQAIAMSIGVLDYFS